MPGTFTSTRTITNKPQQRRSQLLKTAAAAVLTTAAHAHADSMFSLEGEFGNPTEVELFLFTLDEPVAAPGPLAFRTYSANGSASAPGGVNHAGDVIPPGGFDPTLELIDDFGTVAFIDDGTGLPGNVDSLLTFPDIPSPLPANVYGLGLAVLDADFFGFGPNWAVDLTAPDHAMALVLPETIDQVPGVQGISKITVTGPGSHAFAFDGFGIGNASLNATNGGQIDALGPVVMVAFPGESSSITVDGFGSTLSTTLMQLGGEGLIPSGNTQLTVSNNAEVDITLVSLDLWSDARVNLDGGTLNTPQIQLEPDARLIIDNNAVLNLTGPDPIIDNGGMVLWGSGNVNIDGDFALGNALLPDATSLNSGQILDVTGTLTVGPGQTLAASTTGLFSAGTLQIDGGNLVTPILDTDAFSTINAHGTILAEIFQGAATTINAQGPLTLGDPSSTNGFDFFGTLNVGPHRVIINDADQAILAEINNIGPGGSINAVNGALLFETAVLDATGPATIEGDFQNNGTVNGPTNPGEFLTFDDDLSGTGTFSGNIQALQALIPGASPGVSRFSNNLALGPFSSILVEVQAPTPDESPTPGIDHDQINVTQAITLDGTLNVTLLGTDQPPLGTEYVVLTYGTRDPGTGPTQFDNITGTLINTSFALAPLFTDSDDPDTDDDRLILRASIPGDLNLDNKVSVADLSTFALNFNTTPGLYDELTNENAWQLGDFNADGAITVADLSLLALNFGFELLPDGTTTPPTPLSFAAAARLIGIDTDTLPAAGVPEPTTLLPLTLITLLTPRRP